MKASAAQRTWVCVAAALGGIVGCSQEMAPAIVGGSGGSNGGAASVGGSTGNDSGGGLSDGGTSGAGGPGPSNPDEWENPDGNQGQGGSAPLGLSECASLESLSTLGVATDTHAGNVHRNWPGKPGLIPAPRGDGSFDFAWQPVNDPSLIYVSHVERAGQGYQLAWSASTSSLGALAGLAIDDDGLPVVVTAIDEDIAFDEAPKRQHRDGVLQMVKLGIDCSDTYRAELRTDAVSENSLPIYQPMEAGTGRLSIGGGSFAFHHSQLMEWDPDVSQRHQMGRVLVGDPADGSLTAARMMLSHSFDQRLTFDGENFVLLGIGDANFRGVGLTKVSPSGDAQQMTNIFGIKGDGPTNRVFTQIAGTLPSDTGYVHLITTEKNGATSESLNDSRNLAWAHSPKDFEEIEQPDRYRVTALDTELGNATAQSWDFDIVDWWDRSFPASNTGIVWLTDYADVENDHASWPRIVRWSSDRFFVLYEHWTKEAYIETMVLVVDEFGHTIVPAESIGPARMSATDDAFLLNGKAAWLEGRDGGVWLHLVDPRLKHEVYHL